MSYHSGCAQSARVSRNGGKWRNDQRENRSGNNKDAVATTDCGSDDRVEEVPRKKNRIKNYIKTLLKYKPLLGMTAPGVGRARRAHGPTATE